MWRTWREAMTGALYGDNGFYLGSGVPSRHFRTAAHVGSRWADAIAALATRVDDELGRPGDFTIVDVGAGGGELLAHLAGSAPDRWSLTGVDVAVRPSGLPARVGWQRQFPQGVRGLVVAVELLDVVPLDVVVLGTEVPRTVEVDEEGAERLGPPASTDDPRLARPMVAASFGGGSRGDRPAARPSVARHDRRDRGGSSGRRRLRRQSDGPRCRHPQRLPRRPSPRPVPDTRMDLTAHVLFESLRHEGDLILTQREALRRLGVSAGPPDYDADPAGYLDNLSRATESAELLNPEGLGGFTWLLHPVAVDLLRLVP